MLKCSAFNSIADISSPLSSSQLDQVVSILTSNLTKWIQASLPSKFIPRAYKFVKSNKAAAFPATLSSQAVC